MEVDNKWMKRLETSVNVEDKGKQFTIWDLHPLGQWSPPFPALQDGRVGGERKRFCVSDPCPKIWGSVEILNIAVLSARE